MSNTPCRSGSKYSEADKADLEQVLALRVRAASGSWCPLSEIVEVVETTREHSIYHKDLLPVVYVTGDMAGDDRQPALWPVASRRSSTTDWAHMVHAQPENPTSQRQMGRRMAGHLRDLPRHGHRLWRWADPDLSAGGRQFRSYWCRW